VFGAALGPLTDRRWPGGSNRKGSELLCFLQVFPAADKCLQVQIAAASLYTQKTGTPVYLPLPDFILEAVEETPVVGERCFFWNGMER
jgi:hypothetical protein